MPVNLDPFINDDPLWQPFDPLDQDAEFSQTDHNAKDIADFFRQLTAPPKVPPKQYEESGAPITIRRGPR